MDQLEEVIQLQDDQTDLTAAQQSVPDQTDAGQAPADGGHEDSAEAAATTSPAVDEAAAAELTILSGNKMDSISGSEEPAETDAAAHAPHTENSQAAADKPSSTELLGFQQEQDQQQHQPETAAEAPCSAEAADVSVTPAGAEPAQGPPAADASTSESAVQPAAGEQEDATAGLSSAAGQQESETGGVQLPAGEQDSVAAGVQLAAGEQDNTAGVQLEAGQQESAAAGDQASEPEAQVDGAHARVPVAAADSASKASSAHGGADASRVRQPSKAYFVDGVRVSTLVHVDYCCSIVAALHACTWQARQHTCHVAQHIPAHVLCPG
jgi:hypothetical protein